MVMLTGVALLSTTVAVLVAGIVLLMEGTTFVVTMLAQPGMEPFASTFNTHAPPLFAPK